MANPPGTRSTFTASATSHYDIWYVQSAGNRLIGQGCTVSARHIHDGMQRMEFHRQVAYFVKRIVDQVALGIKSPEQGIEFFSREAHYLVKQSFDLSLQDRRNAPSPYGPQVSLPRSESEPDPERLVRFVRSLNPKSPPSVQLTTVAEPAQPAVDRLGFSSSERLPKPIQLHEPGFYVVLKSTTADKLEAALFTSPSRAVIAKFRALNPNLDQIKAGQMIVLSDPDNRQCTREEAILMAAAQQVNAALEDLTPDDADFMARHHDEIQSFLTQGAGAIGIGEVVFANHLDNLKSTLAQIETLHQRTFQQHGHLRTPEFFAQRARLWSQLDDSLGPLLRKGVGIPDHPKLKSALGISSRSLVHRWSKAGGPGRIPGCATHIDGVARASKYIRAGGWVGVGLGASASALKVQETCRVGREEQCREVKYTESGKFAGGLVGGVVGGALVSGKAAIGMCAAIGAGSVGVGLLVCGLVVVAGASTVGGKLGTLGGENLGENIYELSN
ncbi:hypothetical protein N5D52_06365 [Pseudomonas sp. GD03860]|uniref:hypothetical protein n=1 Tax=Pseudomonas TaxID=286 RepID=UPI00236399EF|nr:MULTISPECIES: hypothetical protein [Pseudomonas]MDD2060024.1 hypothetical protein [Pseudomonas putida]MDH0636556.1 hypothetical protein [Pseudomonas sp. GD03860]